MESTMEERGGFGSVAISPGLGSGDASAFLDGEGVNEARMPVVAPLLMKVLQLSFALLAAFAMFGATDAQAQCGPVGCTGGFCGDGICSGLETFNCPQDCDSGGGYCGDGTCGPSETAGNCPNDCLSFPDCGNGEVENGESCDDGRLNGQRVCGCPSDCSGYPSFRTSCDDGQFCTVNDRCNGSGGCTNSSPRSCPSGAPNCNETQNQCVECTSGTSCGNLPNVANGECSSGICVQIICDSGYNDCDGLNGNGCEVEGSCGAVCDNGECEAGEDVRSCPEDCDVPDDCDNDGMCEVDENARYCADCSCGDGICDLYEAQKGCSADCGAGTDCTIDGKCLGDETALNCQADCYCGDSTCDWYENASNSCSDDCVVTCNEDEVCDPGETTQLCKNDCSCGDGICDVSEPENGCVADCEDCNSDGTCDVGIENAYSCHGDCFCGDGACDKYEDAYDACPADCVDDGTCNDDSDCSIPFGTARCDTDSNVCKITDCNQDRGDCDGEYQNGCEATLGTVTRCASCSNNCRSLANTTGEFCSAANRCGFTGCNAGYGNCDGSTNNGCETNTNSSGTHCGTCGNDCSALPNVNATSCSTGGCRIDSCDPGFTDCNGDPADGCEVNTSTASNCGACGNDCLSLANVSGASCLGGTTCGSLICDGGYSNCNGQTADGCEADLGSLETCGFCGRDCSDLPNVTTAQCLGGDACGIVTCDSGWNDCDGNAMNGCETNTVATGGACPFCGDGFVTSGEVCDPAAPGQGGACGCNSNCTAFAGMMVTCDDGTYCTGDEDTCNGSGACMPAGGDPCGSTARPYCDEINDECDECRTALHCSFGTGACDGDEVCLTEGSCQSGTPVTCDVNEECIDPAGTCACEPGHVSKPEGDGCVPVECATAANCDTLNGPAPACMRNACVGQLCEVQPKANGTSCSDGNFCTGNETCTAGTCGTTGDPCDGDEVCDEGGDRCVECRSTADCTGGSVCNVGPGECVECLSASDCPSGTNECQVAQCTASYTCSFGNVASGTSCTTDDNACNGPEECSAGACTPSGDDPCDGNTENPVCVQTDNDTFECVGFCGDGFQGVGEECDQGTSNSDDETQSGCSSECEVNDGWRCDFSPCESAPEPDCGDGMTVGSEVCDDGGGAAGNGSSACGCQNDCNFASASETCDDGRYCTNTDRCDGSGLCVGSGTVCGGDSPYCDETADECDECLSNSECVDAFSCNGIEACGADGQCEAGTNIVCGANEVCGEPSGACECKLGYVRDTQSGTCIESQCTTPADCGTAPLCQVFTCVNEQCVTANVQADGRCGNGIFCDGEDSCVAGECVPPGDPCVDSGQICVEDGERCVDCTSDANCGSDRCDVAAGLCVECLGDNDCSNGGNECRVATCSASNTCEVSDLAAGTTCTSDQNSCNGVEECRAGAGGIACRPTNNNPCDDTPESPVCSNLGGGDFVCLGSCGDGELGNEEECDLGGNNSDNAQDSACSNSCTLNVGWECPTSAPCEAPTPVCGDTVYLVNFEECDEGAANGAPGCGCNEFCTYPSSISTCDDNLFCTDNDFCDGAGACVGSGTTCAGGAAYCTEQAGGRCLDCVSGSDCNNGDACDGIETCGGSGTCQQGTSVSCETNEVCQEPGGTCVCDSDSVVDPATGGCVAIECAVAADCNDQGPAPVCQRYQCVGQLCTTANVASDARCGNEDYCDGLETCASGSCVQGTDPCSGGLCDEGGDRCVACFSDSDCGGARCDTAAGLCVECLTVSDCGAPSNECQNATCSAAGVCGTSSKPVGTSCSSDDLACNGEETCRTSGGSVVCRSSGLNPCAGDPANSVCTEFGEGGFGCDGVCGDGLLADDEECDLGVGENTDDPQVAGCSTLCEINVGWECPEGESCEEPEPDCGDGILLTEFEACDSGLANGTTECGCNDSCAYPPVMEACDDNVYCTANDFCTGSGSCVGSGQTCGGNSPYCDEEQDLCLECRGASDCTDDLYCTGDETCGVNGTCEPGTSVTCDTNETCTEAAQGCVCKPGYVRDGGECVASQCQTALDCETTGGEAPTCQAYVCENSLCSTVSIPTDTRCGNTTYCDGAESCDAGSCVSTGDPCIDGGQICDESNAACVDCLSDADCGGQRCDVDAGLCVECLDVSDCDSPSNECQVATCGMTGTCGASDKPAGTSCTDDGLACNGSETCEVSGGSIVCESENVSPCDSGSDNPICSEAGSGGFDCVGSCGDGLLGVDEDCDAGLANTNDAQRGGCSTICEINAGWTCESGDETCKVPVADCGDGVILTEFEECDDGSDSGTGNGTTSCGCTEECVYASPITTCDDSTFCTADDFCDGSGSCVGSGEECGGDTPYCNESTDVCFECSSQADCTDSLRCTGVETCGVGGSCVAGIPVACDTNELCTEPSGACACAPGFVVDPQTLDCVAEECDEVADCAVLFGDADVCQAYECNGNLCDTVDQSVDVSCGNGLYCDGAESCQSGSCLSAGTPCSGGDICDEGRDRCAECASTSDCDGGLLCDGNRGVCVACLIDSDCPAGANECRAPSCSTLGVCEYSNKPVGTACTSDGRACNGPEQCTILGNGISCRPSAIVPCEEGSENPSCVELGNDQNSCVGRCGDGLLGVGEVCDLGLDNDDDPQLAGCSPSCELNEGWRCPGGADACDEPTAICGDGIVIAEEEACDDGQEINGTTECGCTGSCEFVASAATCSDGLFCNGLDTCDGLGQCSVHGGSPCALGAAACREASDSCDSCVTNADCNDTLACNGTETCDRGLGLCVTGTPVECSGDLVCNDMNGSCACPAGEAEVSAGVCEPIQCSADSDCLDGNVCNGDETCNTAIGQCQTGTALVCTNGLACDGRETCDATTGCTDASDIVCPTGFECAEPAGDCVALCGNGIIDAPEECDDGDENNSDTLADACRTNCTEPVCGDGVTDSGEECDDDNTRPGDGCSANCFDEECLDVTDCDAVDECSSASCLDGACFYNDLSRGTPCSDDGLFCTGDETCDGDGVCESGAGACGNPALPYCVEGDETCVACADAADCADEIFCNGVEVCTSAGECAAGEPAECALGSVCDSQIDACISLCGNGICDDEVENFESCTADCATGEEDTDEDGIPDVVEDQLGTLPGEKDSDGDGVPDDVEVFDVNDPLNTDSDGLINALDPDDDGDGIDTIDEDINGNGDPTDDDTDNDGIPNYLDDDDDGDRVPSEIEAFAASTAVGRKQLGGLLDSDEDSIPNYLDDDDDNDTVLTADEVPESNDSPWLEDTDSDGIPNYIDTDDDGDGLLTSVEVNDFAPDFDGDGIPNHLDVDDDDDDVLTASEVTVYASNPYKEDTDDDLLLDGEEVALGTTLTDSDSDDDGLLDGDEVRLNADPLDSDTDDDGLLDGEEVNVHRTSVRNPDTDEDFLLDGEEIDPWRTDPLDSDTDDDGILDGIEVQNGTDPNDPNSGPEVSGDASGGCQSAGTSAVPLIGILLSLFGIAVVRRRRFRSLMDR